MVDINVMFKEITPIVADIKVADKKEIAKYSGAFSNHKVYATKRELTKLFGNPLKGNCGKVQYHWFIKDKTGNIFEIYDYNNEKKLDNDETVAWHIGYQKPYNNESAISLWFDLRNNISVLRMEEQLN